MPGAGMALVVSVDQRARHPWWMGALPGTTPSTSHKGWERCVVLARLRWLDIQRMGQSQGSLTVLLPNGSAWCRNGIRRPHKLVEGGGCLAPWPAERGRPALACSCARCADCAPLVRSLISNLLRMLICVAQSCVCGFCKSTHAQIRSRHFFPLFRRSRCVPTCVPPFCVRRL